MNDLTPREEEMLRVIHQYYQLHGNTLGLDHDAIKDKLTVQSSRVSDLKKSLYNKGFLQKEHAKFLLTEQALLYFRKAIGVKSRLITPAYLPILGQVRAGRAKQDELRVLIEEASSESATTISIPNLEEGSGAFILEVVGFSMEHEKIYDGEYVIVQPYGNNQMPRQRELIVTFYLPPRNESEVADIAEMDESWFDGPTLKYFTEVPGKERPFRLSWRRDIHSSEYTIETKRIKPVGKVIGVYRDIYKR